MKSTVEHLAFPAHLLHLFLVLLTFKPLIKKTISLLVIMTCLNLRVLHYCICLRLTRTRVCVCVCVCVCERERVGAEVEEVGTEKLKRVQFACFLLWYSRFSFDHFDLYSQENNWVLYLWITIQIYASTLVEYITLSLTFIQNLSKILYLTSSMYCAVALEDYSPASIKHVV